MHQCVKSRMNAPWEAAYMVHRNILVMLPLNSWKTLCCWPLDQVFVGQWRNRFLLAQDSNTSTMCLTTVPRVHRWTQVHFLSAQCVRRAWKKQKKQNNCRSDRCSVPYSDRNSERHNRPPVKSQLFLLWSYMILYLWCFASLCVTVFSLEQPRITVYLNSRVCSRETCFDP